MRGRSLFTAWLLTGLTAFGLFASGATVLWMVGGLLMLGWGLAVSTNYRGAADAMPTRMGIGPFWTESSRGTIRFTFAFFALWGLGVFIAGIVKLV